MNLDFNHRAAIAASLSDLAEDLDCPVTIDGDVFGGGEYVVMEPGEAARIVVNTVLDHPYVQAVFEERERFWEALKFLVVDAGIGPETPAEFKLVLETAFEAAVIESHE